MQQATMSSSDLKSLVAQALPDTVTIIDIKLNKLTASGDNYGSTLLAVDVTIKNEDHKDTILALVAKKIPQNQLVQEMFKCSITFPNEVGFYQKIAPCLQQYQREQGFSKIIDSFPNFYSASSGKIDHNSILLMKNIKTQGFVTLDRTIGFDLAQAKFILNKMAELHATIIALKKHKPHVFEKEVLPFFKEYDIFEMDDDSNDKMLKSALDAIRNDNICKNHLSRIANIVKTSSVISRKKNIKAAFDNPFSTLVHSDMWTNNVMVKLIDNKITQVKFVDYQLYEYTSLTRDVIFFIFSSIPTEVLKENCDSLIKQYYQNFITHLESLKFSTQIYSYDSFLNDMKHMMIKYELFHILTMLPPIYATSTDTKDVEQLDMDNFIFHETEITQSHREKACFVVQECLRRGWY